MLNHIQFTPVSLRHRRSCSNPRTRPSYFVRFMLHLLRQQNPAFLAGFFIACPQGFSPLADAVCAEKPPLHALRTVDLRHIVENPARRSKLRSIPLFRRALRAPYKSLLLRQQNPAFLAGFSIACPQGFSPLADAVCAERPPLHALRTVDLRHIAENPARRSKLRSIPLFRCALRAPYKSLLLRQQNPALQSGIFHSLSLMSFGIVFLRHYQYPAHIAKMSILNINNIYYLRLLVMRHGPRRCPVDRRGQGVVDCRQ